MSRHVLCSAVLLCWLLTGCAHAQAPGRTCNAARCKVAPRIDGVKSPGEWDGAAAVDLDIAMVGGKGDARPARRGQLLLMNSSSNLYVALSVPDAARDFSMSPILTDLAVLGFCRGDELAPGDDKRVVAPGLWADKHVLSAGKDADDPHKDGSASMRWRAVPPGGEYFIEWQIPLKSRDTNDIAAAPGGRLRFNIMYADRFSATLAETEIGGVFGGDMDHARGWGSIVLADNVGPELPAPAPEWISKLFPHTGAPERLGRRLRRVDAGELDVAGRTAGSVIVDLTYPGLDGKDETAQARIFLPPGLHDDPSRRVPLVHNAGYEIDDASAISLMAKGYAVSTPHAHPLNPLGRGVNVDRAIMHAVRRLRFIDPLHVSIQGGSAGGWMTLMLTADAFPLVWSMPDVPPIHWGYNAAYIGEHQAMAGPAPGSETPRMPVLQAVGVVSEQAKDFYGQPFDSPAYLAISPLAHLNTITAPTLATFSTADMLVPVDQVGAEFVKPHDAKQFPAGFTTSMSDRFPGVAGKRTLLAALPTGRREVFALPPVADPTRLGPDGQALGTAKPVALPFSKEKTWSIVVIDEGPVEPAVGHFKYAWAIDHEPFRTWAEGRGVTPDQITGPKLERLMKRLLGEPWRPLKVRPGGKGPEIAGNQLDYPEAERADVLLGLRAFASDDTCSVRLGKLYSALPARLKALGPRLGSGTAEGVRSALEAARRP